MRLSEKHIDGEIIFLQKRLGENKKGTEI